MKRALHLLALLAVVVPCENVVLADDCVCALVPMYPVDSTNWMHYATVNLKASPGCIYKYPTGHIDLPVSSPESCESSPNLCGTCTALGTAPSDPVDLHFGPLNSTPPLYAALDTADEFKAFLKDNVPNGANPAIYDNFTFSRPFEASFSQPIVVVLTRPAGNTSERFYAVVWRMRVPHSSVRSFAGIEIAGAPPSGVSMLNPFSSCNAVSTEGDGNGNVTHKPIPGLLQVQFSSETNDVAFIRLHNSDANRAAGYKPCKP